MKNAKNIFLDYAWEIHLLCDAEDKAADIGKNGDVVVPFDTAVRMFANNLTDCNSTDDQYKYDGIRLNWSEIAAEYGWQNLSEEEKNALVNKHVQVYNAHMSAIGSARRNGGEPAVRKAYADAYVKLG